MYYNSIIISAIDKGVRKRSRVVAGVVHGHILVAVATHSGTASRISPKS